MTNLGPQKEVKKHALLLLVQKWELKRLFLTRDNFRRSLLPLAIPKSFQISSPNVSSAIFSATSILLVVNGDIYGYDFEDNSWQSILVTEKHLTDIYAEYCCYSTHVSCQSISNRILAYSVGQPTYNTTIYMSNSLGFHFEELFIPKLALLNGTLEGFFFFHAVAKFAVLLKRGNVGRFVYIDRSLEGFTWGMIFPMEHHHYLINLPGLNGFLIIWDEDHLFFSLNSGQLIEEVPARLDEDFLTEPFRGSMNIYAVAVYDNELALMTTDFGFFYGSLGLLATSITKVKEEYPTMSDSAIMFGGAGHVIMVTPGKDNEYEAYDFFLCDVNMQIVLKSLEIAVKDCKVEILRGDFNKKVLVLDMGETLQLTAQLVFQPSQSPVPIVTVSNPHSLGFKVKMYEDGYTYDGNTKYAINITLMQQYLSGRADKNFISEIKIASLSSVTLDIIDRGISCIDLQPPSGLISIGCDWEKYIVIHSALTACSKHFLKPEELEDDYVYVIEKEAYDPSYHFQSKPDNEDITVGYDYESLGCPGLVYYNTPWKPVIELWKGKRFVEVVDTEFVMIEINGLHTYNYSLTVGKAACLSQAQNWVMMIESSPNEQTRAWHRKNYISCHEKHKDAPLLWPNVEYQVLGGRTKNSIIFDQRNGIYVFFLRVVDPLYSYCDLSTTFSIYVYGAFPKQALPHYWVAIGMLGFMLFTLWLGYIIPKMLKSERGRKFKSFFQNLCHKNKKEKLKFHMPKFNK
ncbi:cation channel sperm-associated protein subunit delta [Trichosurus vulpecula]|uniref:cation channel sperm-associated protein subunit delta n=1 Tax=Trichosurus vulpecula TaxID=9337 RepID=UPI00186B24A7|nr:cation channel sperm-associated protein subunit delta [Trichosurus vulpecula]